MGRPAQCCPSQVHLVLSLPLLDEHRQQDLPSALLGIVGDWRNHFSPIQSALFNEKYQEEMGSHPWALQWDMD